MAAVRSQILRKALRFGSGVGIAVEGNDLAVYLVRVRPAGPRVLGTLRIQDFRERPAAEWGAEYAKFLAAHSASHLCALMVPPRQEMIVRQVRLPGVADADAPAAIRFQLDSLHPFGEEEVAYDFERVGRTDAFTVAMMERRLLDSYTALFSEAGVKLAGITFSGGAVFHSLRIYGEPPADGLLAVEGLNAAAGPPYEIYGESPSHPLFSACLELPLERSLALAASEMRLPEGTETRDLISALPAWHAAPDGFDFSEAGMSRAALPYAAGLTAACPRLGTPVNLLPAEARSFSSRLTYVPMIVFGSILAILCVLLAARGPVMERSYLEYLGQETRRWEARAKQVEATDRQAAAAAARIQALDDFRRRTKSDLDLLLEINGILPPPAWIMNLSVDRGTVIIAGETEQADGLLKKLDASPRFAASEFTMPIGRTATGESFRIRTQREGGGR